MKHFIIGGSVKCPKCGKIIRKKVFVCPYCGAIIPPSIF